MIPSLTPFRARPPWVGGTLQTLRALRYPFLAPLPPGHRLWLPLGDGDALAAMLHVPAGDAARPLAVLVHGLAGTEDDPYLREAAAALLRRGFPVLRLNLRGNAVSRPRSSSHYHLGRSEDLAAALHALPEPLVRHGIVLAGWSLGGALALLLLDRHLAEPGMPRILAGAAIGPPLDPALAHRTIDENWVLGRALLAFYRREVLAVPTRDLPEPLRHAAQGARSLVEFEAEVTAPRFGYPSYSVFCEANRPAAVLPRLRVPTLVVMAADDPLVPIASMESVDWPACPAVLPLAVAGGGHCGFYDWRVEALSIRAMAVFFEGVLAEQPATPMTADQPAAA